MLKGIKFCRDLIVNPFIALIGTAILEGLIGRAFRPQSLTAILWKEWGLSFFCAAMMGFFMWRTWRASAAKWSWILPSVWFGLRFLLALLVRVSQGILTGASIWCQFSGTDCVNGLRSIGCRNFFLFTIPFIRGVSYSGGAYFSSLLSQPRSQSAPAPRN
jgi:hypothetical protein